MKQKKSNEENTIQMLVFESPEFGKVRTITDAKGNPLFCGKDVCEVLGYKRADLAVHQHVSQHDAVKRCVGVPTGKRFDGSPAIRRYQMLFVNESGFYCLVFGSKLPIAERFKLWVTSVVLPQIRKTGGFLPLHEGDTDEETIHNAEEILRKTLKSKESFIEQQEKLIAEQTSRIHELNTKVDQQMVKIQKSAEEIVKLESDVDRLLPKALYVDNVLDSITCYTTTQVAKELGMSAQELNRLLCAMHVQYYQSGQYLLYVDFAHRGLAKSRTHGKAVYEGRYATRTYLVWTERGRKMIHELKEQIEKLNTQA